MISVSREDTISVSSTVASAAGSSEAELCSSAAGSLALVQALNMATVISRQISNARSFFILFHPFTFYRNLPFRKDQIGWESASALLKTMRRILSFNETVRQLRTYYGAFPRFRSQGKPV
jgi:hypothetical protein